MTVVFEFDPCMYFEGVVVFYSHSFHPQLYFIYYGTHIPLNSSEIFTFALVLICKSIDFTKTIFISNRIYIKCFDSITILRPRTNMSITQEWGL